MLYILASSASTNVPFIITISSLIGTLLIFILITYAKILYRGMDRTIDVIAWRMNMLDDKAYKIKLSIQNTTNAAATMRSISLIVYDGSRPQVISMVKDMPIQNDMEENAIYGNTREGYYLRIDTSKKYYVILEFKLDQGFDVSKGDEVFLSYIKEDGSLRTAKINLFTDEAQLLHFKTQK